jgi:hypothetical protein
MAYLYVYIRNQINDNRSTLNAKEKTKLKYGEALNLDEKTIYNYIKELNSVDLILGIGKDWGIDHRYNVYHFPEIKGDNFIVLPSLIYDASLTTEEKGVMLFIKANCIDGTNHFHFKSMAELKAKIGVGKNSTVIKDLESKGYVRIIGDAIIITYDAFPLYLNGKPDNYMYHIIYKYCIDKGVVPPMKEKWCLIYLYEKYANRYKELEDDLHSKCKILPNDVSLHYFCKALLNKMPEKRPHYNYEFIM